MTNSKMDEVRDDRKLNGKPNYISWKREFERAARTEDVLEYLTGVETVPSKPNKNDYFGKSTKVDLHRYTRAMSA